MPPSNRHQLNVFQREHEQILNAIRSRAATQARSAMRRHLNNSRTRYEKLTAEPRFNLGCNVKTAVVVNKDKANYRSVKANS